MGWAIRLRQPSAPVWTRDCKIDATNTERREAKKVDVFWDRFAYFENMPNGINEDAINYEWKSCEGPKQLKELNAQVERDTEAEKAAIEANKQAFKDKVIAEKKAHKDKVEAAEKVAKDHAKSLKEAENLGKGAPKITLADPELTKRAKGK